MGKNHKKVPNSAINKPDRKNVKVPSQKIESKPVWRFSTTDKGGPFPWPKGQEQELAIVSKLHEFDSMDWSEIKGKQHHFLSYSCLSKEAKDRLKTLELDDEVENLFSFHLQGKPRIIAIYHLGQAKLLWYDPEHKVCPSKLKHT
jgi:hypothetical protein